MRIDEDFTSVELLAVGIGLAQSGHIDKAINVFRDCTVADPNSHDAFANLGELLVKQKRHKEASAALSKATLLNPKNAAPWASFGRIMEEEGQLSIAETMYRRAVELCPTFTEFWMGLGHVHHLLGQYEDSILSYGSAAATDPSNWRARLSRGIVRLMLNPFDIDGMADFEYRMVPFAWPLGPHVPIWNSSWQLGDIMGKKPLICCEQGLGDILQYIRYREPLMRRLGTDSAPVFCPASRKGLLTRVTAEVFTEKDTSTTPVDFQIGLSSIPYLLAMYFDDLDTPPPPKIAHPPAMAKIPADGNTIGICWRGNPQHGLDRYRSLPLSAFVRTLRNVNARIVSLQYEQTPEELELGIEQSDQSSWRQTIESYQRCDMVVSVDTFAGHLAGTLGIPTKLLIYPLCDSRWAGKDKTNRWYPSVELHRQQEPLEWGPVLEEIRLDLEKQFGTR